MDTKLTHVDESGNPSMVNVSDKPVTKRLARARARVRLGKQIVALLQDDDIHTQKGPVFKTAVIAGVMAAKRTAELIPFCHPLGLDDCQITVHTIDDERVEIICQCQIEAKTGVEMEALTGASIAALTIYDMCKALSKDISVEEVRLLHKSGGKTGYTY